FANWIGVMEDEWIARSRRWGYFRIIAGTIVGGIIGFYYMHRAELKYKEMWNERLKKYEAEKKKRQEDSEFA
ncbi:hypothetical protein M569_05117, partial [Genlisea aurea]